MRKMKRRVILLLYVGIFILVGGIYQVRAATIQEGRQKQQNVPNVTKEQSASNRQNNKNIPKESSHNNSTSDQNKTVEEYLKNSEVEYDEIQSVIDDIMDSNDSFQFRTFVSKLMEGGQGISAKSFLDGVLGGVKNELLANVKILARIIVIAIFAAIFTNFAAVFIDNQVADTGFYITYILLFCILIASFSTVADLALVTVKRIIEFMTVLIPSYFMAVAMASGAVSSAAFYEFTIVVIALVNIVLVKVMIPLIKVYLIIMLANNLSKEDMLSKLAGTIETIVKWALKSLIVLVVGFNAVQAMVAPVSDSLKRSILIKAGSAIPGVGNLLSGVAETVMGASVLLKNAVGAAGLVVIIVICSVPIIKLTVNYFIYRIGESIIQPVSDKRIANCISAAGVAANLLLQVVVVAAILFIITLTIVSASTNMALK